MSKEAPPPRPGLGVLEAVSAAALYGSSGIFAVRLFQMGVTPHSVALYRMVLGALFLLVWALLVRRDALRVPRRTLLLLLVGGGIPVAAFQVVYQLSIDAAGVPTTVALLYLAPVFVVAASPLLLGERPTPLRVALSLVVVAGVWLTVLGADTVQPHFGSTGLVWGVLSGACYAAYTLWGRYATPRWGTLPTVVYASLGAAAILALTLPALSSQVALPATPAAWGVLAAFALLTVSAASLLFFDALGRIEASRVAVAAATEPVVAALLATLILAQGMAPVGWVGIGVVVVGVAGVGRSRAVVVPDGG